MLRFKSQPVRLIQTFLNGVPLIAGLKSEIQTLKIAMGEFTEGDVPTASFKVVLEQRAEFKSGSGVPEIYGGSLEIALELPQLKRMLSSWRRTVFVWIGFSIFAIQVLVLLIFCRPLVLPGGTSGASGSKKKSWPDKIAWYRAV
ncbi:hypothetical protein ACS0TY_016763 [Phlomoides rotata]